MATFSDKFGANALFYVGKLVEKTCSFQLNGEAYFEEAFNSDKPIILTAWHGMTFALIAMFRKRLDVKSIVVLLPDDWRGVTLQLFIEKVGGQPFPVNLEGAEPMKTARQLSRLVKQIKAGSNGYLTPDGPSGPSHVVKPGLTYIAQKSGAIILPMGAYARHAYQLNRWDRYLVPYPFRRISVEVGKPFTVEKGEDLTAVNETLTNTLNRVTLQAAANYYELVE